MGSQDSARSVGPYRVLRELGRGSNGVVYLAQREGLARSVALKVVLDPSADDLARFELEARVASKLDHPGIVSVLDAGRRGGQVYYAMQYCEGRTLQERLAEGPMAPAEAAALVASLARTVGYAHEQGVLHRDLKPANVILTPAGPRLTDFGLARDHSLRRSLTATGDMMGTPAYMSPEQWRGQRDVDARSDVYGLGVILYHCLAGQRPFDAQTVSALGMQVTRGEVAPLLRVAPHLPPRLAEICAGAMALRREDRYPSASSLAEALEAWACSGAAPEPEPRVGAAAGSPRAVWLASVGLLLAAAVLTGLALLRGSTPAIETASPTSPTSPTPPTSPTSPVSPPSSLVSPSPPLRRAPSERLDALASLAIEPFRLVRAQRDDAALRKIADAVPRLLRDYPDDPDLLALDVLLGVIAEDRDPLEALRSLRLLQRRGPLRPELVGLAARLALSLGFERLACDMVRARCGVELPDPWLGLTAMHMLVASHPPCQDLELACRFAEETVDLIRAAGELVGEASHPPAWDVLANLALYRMAQGRHEEAHAAAVEAANVVRHPSWQREIASLPTAIGAGLIRPERALENISVAFGVGTFLGQLTGAAGRSARPRDAPRAVEALLALRVGRPSLQALVWLRAARIFQAGDPARARDLLRRAVDLDVEDAEVARLVRRALARVLLELDAPQEVEALALSGSEETLLSAGEQADAWVLVARARLARGERDAAAEALEAARLVEPYDRRELDALLRQLR